MTFNYLLFTTYLLAASMVLAHPGHDGTAEMKARSGYLSTLNARALSECTPKLRARRYEAETLLRRQAMIDTLRERRRLKRHNLLEARATTPAALTKSHLSTENYTMNTPAWEVFGSNSAILSPEVTEGPYYVAGEMVRQDVSEDQSGIPLYVDFQIIDMNECVPLKGVAIDFWHTNATGVYSGIQANGNGNSDDASNVQNTFCRGIQVSNDNGTMMFESIFPGHYSGRTTHIHLMSHVDATVQSNNTITGGTVAHVSQMFFDQDLLIEVEKVSPYSTNQQPIRLNADDNILLQEASSSDPIAQYVLLGETVADGIFAWLNFGIDPTYSRNVSTAATCTEGGCEQNENAGMGGPGGGPPPSGGMPGMPSGTALVGNSSSSASATAAVTSSGAERRLRRFWGL